MAQQLNEKDIVGMYLPVHDSAAPLQVIGIMKDFNFESLHSPIEPLTLTLENDRSINFLFVKINGSNLVQPVETIKKAWNEITPGTEFEGSWLDENTDRQYRNENRLSNIFISGAIIAIVISCIGLFAIAVMMMIQRTKEVGIRKVLGATVSGIVLLLSRDFIKLVGIAALIAFPAGWWLMNNWLQNFAYKIDISWWIFAVAGLMAVVIALVTVSFHAIKVGIANPVKSLRTE